MNRAGSIDRIANARSCWVDDIDFVPNSAISHKCDSHGHRGSTQVLESQRNCAILHGMIAPRLAAASAALSLALAPLAAHAELAVGATAPDFTTEGALAGKPLPVSLQALLAKGPVVLYFYPKAFTPGCTMEAHAFADASADFAKAGATVVGMSNDTIDALEKFSSLDCRDKFTVAAASPAVIKAYDVALMNKGADTGLANRTSYVITPDGRIVYAHTDMDWHSHVEQTLAMVQKLNKEH
jgi:peroxiredoxin